MSNFNDLRDHCAYSHCSSSVVSAAQVTFDGEEDLASRETLTSTQSLRPQPVATANIDDAGAPPNADSWPRLTTNSSEKTSTRWCFANRCDRASSYRSGNSTPEVNSDESILGSLHHYSSMATIMVSNLIRYSPAWSNE